MGQYNSGMDDVISPPIDAGELPHEPAKWPVVLGWFSIVLGGLGILKNACSAASNLVWGGAGMKMFMGGGNNPQAEAMEKAMTGMGPLIITMGVMSVVALGVSVLLLVAGIQLVKRQRSSVKLHVAWAWVRILVVLAEVGAGLVMNRAMTTAMLESMPKGPNAPPPGMMSTIMLMSGVCSAVFMLVLFLAYPITVLIVLSKPWAKAEIARWGTTADGPSV